MDTELLKSVLRVPTSSGQETMMIAFLLEWAGQRGIRCWRDKHRNVYMLKGAYSDGRKLPCVGAHIDSVQPIFDIDLREENGIITAERDGKQAGFGADDKAGVAVCLSLIDQMVHIGAVFFAGEEVGAQGAYLADAAFFKDYVGCFIEYDCPSFGMLSYSAGGQRLFENGKPFIEIALPVLMKHGTTLWQRHPYTDVMAIRKRFPISCLNLSCGYHNWHAPNECVVIDEVSAAIDQGFDLICALGGGDYRCPVTIVEDAEAPPAIGIGGIRVPRPMESVLVSRSA